MRCHTAQIICSTSVCVYALNTQKTLTHSLTRWTRAHYCGLIFALEAAASVYPSCSVNCGSSRLRGEAGRSPSVQRPRFCSYSKEAHCLKKATPGTPSLGKHHGIFHSVAHWKAEWWESSLSVSPWILKLSSAVPLTHFDKFPACTRPKQSIPSP